MHLPEKPVSSSQLQNVMNDILSRIKKPQKMNFRLLTQDPVVQQSTTFGFCIKHCQDKLKATQSEIEIEITLLKRMSDEKRTDLAEDDCRESQQNNKSELRAIRQ